MKFVKLISMLLPLFILSGCWDSKQISNLSIVIGMGVEREENGMLGVLLQVVIPKNISFGGSNSSGDGSSYANYYAESEDIVEGVSAIDRQCDSDVFLNHSQLMIFGRRAAEEGVAPYIDYCMSNNGLRITDLLFVAEGSIKEIFDTKVETIEVPSQYIINIGRTLSKTSEGATINVLDFVKNAQSKSRCSLVPIIKVENETEPVALKIEGMAVFDEYRMIGVVSGKEAQGVFWLRDSVGGGYVNAKFNEGSFAAVISRAKTDIKINIDRNNNISFAADIKAEVYQNRDENALITKLGILKVEQKIAETIKSEILASVYRMQQLNADVFGFGTAIYRKNHKLWEQIEDNWQEIFQNINVEINVDVTIKASEKMQ